MKILFISNLYPPNVVGGYERLCHQVATSLGEREHEIHVLTSTFGELRGDSPGQTVRRNLVLLADLNDIYKPFEISTEQRETINAGNISAFRDAVELIKPDLIFCWNMYFFDYSLLDEVGSCGVPSMLFLTDNWLIAALTPERIHDHFARHVQGNESFVPMAATADRYLPVSAVFGSRFVQDLHSACGYQFNREVIVHNGVSPPHQDSDLAPDRRRTYRPDQFRLLFAGRFVDLKGPQDCIAALPAIQKSLGPDVEAKLTLVGDMQDASFKKTLLAQIRDSGVSDQIELMEPVSEGELTDLFNTHDIFLFPSHYEPFALTLILAMASGIPVVASNIGGNPEIVLDRKTGLLFRKGDTGHLVSKVLELWREPTERAHIAERGRRFARRFTFSRMIRQLERELVDECSRARTVNGRSRELV